MSSVLDPWLDAIEAANALIGGRELTRSRLAAWLPWLEAAVGGDETAEAELLRLVALDAQNLALERRPASLVVSQPLLLASAWPAARSLSHRLVRIAADAHALGATTVKDAQLRALVADHAPLVRIGRGWLAFLLGPMVSETVDVVFGRLLRAAVGCRSVALDIAGAAPPNPLFLRTLEGFAGMDTGSVQRLTVTGAPDRDGLRRRLAQARVPTTRVAVGDLAAWVGSVETPTGPSVNVP